MIYTSSRVYFHIKNPISNSFNRFNTVLDRASISREVRGPGVNVTETLNTAEVYDGFIYKKNRGSLRRLPQRRVTHRSQPLDRKWTAKIRKLLK
jgi:hypothetical protein